MEIFYLIVVIILFLLAISDLVVGVSNDAVNFLNSAVGSKAGTFKLILFVAALGILAGCTFSGGMMEVARKGIFHPEHFYFSEIILLFLAVMVTDVILLDMFNTLGLPTSTTVSIVFELMGAAVALSLIKVYTDPDALNLGEYINSEKALAIISGILLSVVVAFSSGVIVQYLTRLLFSFNYEKKLKYFGAIWGGMAIAAITYFLLIKGSKGASFMDDDLKAAIMVNTKLILFGSFIVWAIIFELLILFTRVNIIKFIVLFGTFSLAMAFAGNDLVNFIGVPLAGYNSYEIWVQSSTTPDNLLMNGLAGKVPTPTLLLLLAGIIMAITLYASKKARSVIKTSLDLGRQYEGSERFASFAVSRSLVRKFGKMAKTINNVLPEKAKLAVENQFDQKPFITKQKNLGKEAPEFDLIRAAVTLVVASILITVGTNLKLPLSTTYVTFMVFMGTSLADGAWGRESAVYRISGVLSVVGGWFFTALAAFTVAFVLANLFYFGGTVAIVLVLVIAGYTIYKTHMHAGKDKDDLLEFGFEKGTEDEALTGVKILETSSKDIRKALSAMVNILKHALEGLTEEDLAKLTQTFSYVKKFEKKVLDIKQSASQAIENIDDEHIDAVHLYILAADYLNEVMYNVKRIVKLNLDHVDNNHKPLIPVQIEELNTIQNAINEQLNANILLFESLKTGSFAKVDIDLQSFVDLIRSYRKNQIKRIKNHEVGTRNSNLYLHHLGEYRNVALFSYRMAKVLEDLIIRPEESKV